MTQALYMGLFGAWDFFVYNVVISLYYVERHQTHVIVNVGHFHQHRGYLYRSMYHWVFCRFESHACMSVCNVICLSDKQNFHYFEVSRVSWMDIDWCSKMNSCEFTHWELDFWWGTWKLLLTCTGVFVIWMYIDINMYEWLCLF